MIETLNILEGYNLASRSGRPASSIHLTTEAYRRAFFDRAEFLGDPDFSKIPVAQLIDKRYGAAWRQSIDPAHASTSKDLRRPDIFSQLEQYAAAHPQGGVIAEPDHTTHFSVVDPEGNAVAVTTTLNDTFGSRVTAEGLGFLLNDEMDDFTSKQGAPNMFGLIQGPANAIGPEASAVGHGSDHRIKGRQVVFSAGLSGRAANYQYGDQHPHGCGGLRNEYSGSGERSALSSSVVAG